MTYDEWNEIIAAAKEMDNAQRDERTLAYANSIAALICTGGGDREKQIARAHIVCEHIVKTIILHEQIEKKRAAL